MKHSKIFSIAVVLCLVYTGTRAQSISKSVVASAGGSYSGPAMMVDYTIGQSVTNYSASSSYMVTEGFHPIADEVPTAAPVVKNTVNSLLVKAFPNPVSSILHISIQQATAAPLSLTVTDVTGKTVKAMSLDAELNTDAAMDLSTLTSGMYYIVVNAGKENAQVMKIVKN